MSTLILEERIENNFYKDIWPYKESEDLIKLKKVGEKKEIYNKEVIAEIKEEIEQRQNI